MRIYPVFLPYAGCPHRCRFCRQEGESLPAPEEVSQGLDKMLPPAGDGEIAFYGGTFTLLSAELTAAYLQAAARFVAAGRAGGIRVSTRPDALPEETVERLIAGGVTTVEIGCQSFSAEVLARAGRGHRPEAAAKAAGRLQRRGLRIGLQLMPGLPGGDRKEALASLDTALGLRPDFLRLYPAVVFRGTLLEADLRAGNYSPPTLEEAVAWCADMLCRCRRAGVPTARIGLQEAPGLAAEVVAGPWHPAFGQLVRSRLWRLALERQGRVTGGRRAVVAPADLADALGHRRENLAALQRSFGTFAIVAERGVPRGTWGMDRTFFDFWQTAGEAAGGEG